MNNHLIICFFSLFLLLTASCSNKNETNEYANLRHRGEAQQSIYSLKLDTLFLDASHTSTVGEWHLHKGKFYFFDRNQVGTFVYDQGGTYIENILKQGRGPGEIISSALASYFSPDGNLFFIDQALHINEYNQEYNKISSISLYDRYDPLVNSIEDLLTNPDPEVHYMYEFMFGASRIRTINGKIILPIITEHQKYNGYIMNENNSDFWKRSYNFLSIGTKEEDKPSFWGHYPPLFGEKNIPIFSIFSFDVSDSEIYITYRADPKIYVRDENGELKHTFGFASEDISTDYLETTSFDEYLSLLQEHERTCGYYTDIRYLDGYIFRSYKKDEKKGYGVQIYKNDDLIGDIQSEESLRMIGVLNDEFIASLPCSEDGDLFRIIKFQLQKK